MDEHLKDLEQRLDAVNKKFEVRFKSMEDRFDQRFKTWEENMNKWMETVMRQQNRDDNQSMIEGGTTKAPGAPDLQNQQHEQARNSALVESDRRLWTETDPQKQQSTLEISNTAANRRLSPDTGNPTSFNLNFSPKLEFPKFDEFEANGKLEVVIESELKEALESAEHKNRKIPIIALELFDESPKKEELKEEKLDIGLDIDKVVSAIGPWIKLVWLELHNMKSEANNVREMSVLIFDPGGLSLVSEMVFVRAVHEIKWMSKMEISIHNSWFGSVVSSLPPGYEEGAPDTWRLVKAHGTAVGLPTDDDMGNSEVGHNALGAGRIFAQGAKLCDLALECGKIFEGDGFKYIKESFGSGTLHLVGLLSDGGVDSRLDQLQLLLKGAAEHGAINK